MRQLPAQPLHELTIRLERHEIRLRQVAVVLRLLLRAERRSRLVGGVEVHRLLHDLPARLVDLDLALDLALDPLRREAERVHVLELGAGAELVGALGANRDVDVEAERALLHLRVGDPELDDGLAQQLEEALRVVGGVEVGRGHDLDERRPGPVEVDERVLRACDAALGAADVDVLRRVLLEVRADDPDLDVALGGRQRELAVDAERLVVLGDLVALRQVGIEVVLAVEDRVLDDAAAERVAEEDRHLDRAPVWHGQRAGVRETDGARARVLGREVLELAAAEHLRPRLQVDVDLEADDRLPIHRSRSGT